MVSSTRFQLASMTLTIGVVGKHKIIGTVKTGEILIRGLGIQPHQSAVRAFLDPKFSNGKIIMKFFSAADQADSCNVLVDSCRHIFDRLSSMHISGSTSGLYR